MQTPAFSVKVLFCAVTGSMSLVAWLSIYLAIYLSAETESKGEAE